MAFTAQERAFREIVRRYEADEDVDWYQIGAILAKTGFVARSPAPGGGHYMGLSDKGKTLIKGARPMDLDFDE